MLRGPGHRWCTSVGRTPTTPTRRGGLQRTVAPRSSVYPLALRGFEVYFTNRWPGMDPNITWTEVAARHADSISDHFGRPVDMLGHSTGGSLLLQLIADRPEVVRRGVVASAGYALGPIAKRAQLSLLDGLERTGHFTATAMLEGSEGMVRRRWVRALLTPLLHVAAPRIRIE